VIGYGLKVYLDRTNNPEYEITNKEFAITAFAVLLVVLPGTAWVGKQVAINNQVTFQENRSGWETGVQWERITCTRDGACKHCYDCDPYQVPYDCGYDDDKGKHHDKTCYKTEYHQCPYTDEEWTFVVNTSVGDFTIAENNLPTDPDDHRWRTWHSVPSYLPSGVPDFWTAVRNRVAQGTPGPATARASYPNYILASENSIIKRFSADTDQYLKVGLMPDIVTDKNIQGLYELNRVYMVGVNPPGNWSEAINRFNAHFGSALQGDLHLVIVDSNKVTNPDSYVGALLAYWQGPKFDKDALSKNGVVIVLGTKDGKTVDWARAATGMPSGNEDLLVQLQYDLKGAPLDPATLLGSPTAKVVSKNASGDDISLTLDSKADANPTSGLLERILWGDHAFKRVHMNGNDGKSGYQYLLTELEPTFWQQVGILFVMLLLSGGGWGACLAYGHHLQRLGVGMDFRRGRR